MQIGGVAQMENNCLFCKIIQGEIPSRTLYEDHRFKVILDAFPASEGHVIIISKNHYTNLFELPEEDAREIMVLAKKIGRGMMRILGCEGLNILQNNGEEAGQTVFHYHLHLIPRYKDDNISIKWKTEKIQDDKADMFIEKISKSLEL